MENAIAELAPLTPIYDRVKLLENDREAVVKDYWALAEESDANTKGPPRDDVASEIARLAEIRTNARGTLGLVESVTFSNVRLDGARQKLRDAISQADAVFIGFNNGYTYFMGGVSPVAIHMRIVNDVLPADERATIAVIAATNALREAHVAALSNNKAEIEHLINLRRLLIVQLVIGGLAFVIVLTYVVAVVAAIRRTRIPRTPDIRIR
jgi:hypothetical protein